jgi:hypothetical protein
LPFGNKLDIAVPLSQLLELKFKRGATATNKKPPSFATQGLIVSSPLASARYLQM